MVELIRMKVHVPDGLGKIHEIEEKDLIPRVSVYGVLIQKNKVLLGLNYHATAWGFPGGGVDQGESHLEALIREFKEETGLTLQNNEPKRLDSWQEYFYAQDLKEAWHSTRYFYAVGPVSGTLMLHGNKEDTAAAQWYTKAEAMQLPMQEKVKNVLSKLDF